MKKKVSKKDIVSFCPFPSCAVSNLITAVLLLLVYSTVIVTRIPGALAFITTTRSKANNYSKYYGSRVKRFLDEKGSVEDTERSSLPTEQQEKTEADCLQRSKTTENERKSRISSIRCENFAGMTNGKHGETLEDENAIVLNFDETTMTPSMKRDECWRLDGDRNDEIASGGNLVSVTGETGSGKSLLVTKIADLLTGGKASVSLIHNARNNTNIEEIDGDVNNADFEIPALSAATAEIVLSLHNEMHISFVSKILRRMNLDPTAVIKQSGDLGTKKKLQDDGVTLKLKRVISMTSTSTNKKNRNEGGKQKKQRIKSTCFINDHSVSLKILKAIASPLITVVNAPIAAISLGRPQSRLSMIDSGISLNVLASVQQLQTGYRECKQYRKSLEKEMERQLLPASILRRDIDGGREGDSSSSASDNNQQLKLLRHWIDELNGFEKRISDLQESLRSGGKTSTKETGTEELDFLLCDFNGLDWTSGLYHDDRCEVGDAYTSPLYEKLLDLHDYLKLLDARIITASEARESLASLSSSDSVRVALDRTRRLLLDVAAVPQQRNGDIRNVSKSTTGTSAHSSVKTRVSVANEKAHEMLNLVEDAISECANFLDDDEKGLVATLRVSRRSCSTPTEKLLDYITEWNTLARKHGVSPNQLPLCHDALKKELDGGVEAGRLLPEAKIAEKKSLNELKEACRVLTEARMKLCQRVSASISRRLPRLGMENSKFEARLFPIDNPSYSKSHLGADEIDFFLIHGDRTSRNDPSIRVRTDLRDQTIGGKIENIASSGEKARLLLAIECEIPGSISAIGRDSLIGGEEDLSLHVSPVAVIYDEIDAHLGGRASISVAQMLFDQSKACQVLSITHCPSLAAIADTHICVHRRKSDQNGKLFDVVANRVEGVERRKELARMASGDMVVDEAEVFADALLRDASSIKTRIPNIQS